MTGSKGQTADHKDLQITLWNLYRQGLGLRFDWGHPFTPESGGFHAWAKCPICGSMLYTPPMPQDFCGTSELVCAGRLFHLETDDATDIYRSPVFVDAPKRVVYMLVKLC